jgi:hypothetical protein
MIKNIMKNIGVKPFVEAEGIDTAKALERYKTDAENMTTKQLEYYVEDLKNGTGNLGPEYLEERMKIYGDELNKRKETAKKPDVSKSSSLTSGLKKLAEQNEKFLNRRDELIAKGKLTEKEAEEMKNLNNIIQMNTSAMLNLTGDNKEKKPLTSPDLIPSYDDFDPYRD